MEPSRQFELASRLYAHTTNDEFLDQWTPVIPYKGGWIHAGGGGDLTTEVPATDWLIVKPETPLKPFFNSYSAGAPRIPEGLRELTAEEYEQVRQGQLPEAARVAGSDIPGVDKGQPYTPPRFIR